LSFVRNNLTQSFVRCYIGLHTEFGEAQVAEEQTVRMIIARLQSSHHWLVASSPTRPHAQLPQQPSTMEDASGHNDPSNTRRGGSTPRRFISFHFHAVAWTIQSGNVLHTVTWTSQFFQFPTPRRGADKSDSVLDAVAWKK